MSKDPLVRKSKHLSLVLRHQPESVGLKLDSAGWVDVAALLSAMKWSIGDLEHVVADNNKKRFEFNEDKTRIRASQGHSVDVDLGYKQQDPPGVLYHGTSREFLQSILANGIQKKDRHHVHLSPDTDTALVDARRRKGPVVLEVNADRMRLDGFAFYLSTNGVWLVDDVPAKYIKERST
jgi:putative RNA 2'-phosphotransferase